MAIPLAIAAGAAAIPSIFQGISGIFQRNKGRKMAENNIRPHYSRPTEVGQGLTLAENKFLNSGLPGADKLKSDLSAVTASNLDAATQAATSSDDVLDAITKLDFNEKQQLNDLAMQEVAYKDENLQRYQTQLGESARYADKEFSYNKDQPYQDTAAAASALIEGGNMNVGNAVNGISSIATSALMSGAGDSQSPARSTAQLPPLPVSSSKFSVNPGMGARMVWDPYTKKMKVQ